MIEQASPSAFTHREAVLLVEWLHTCNKENDLFDQDEVIYPFKVSHHKPAFVHLVQKVKSQREKAINLKSKDTEIKVVLKQEAPSCPHLLMDREHQVLVIHLLRLVPVWLWVAPHSGPEWGSCQCVGGHWALGFYRTVPLQNGGPLLPG